MSFQDFQQELFKNKLILPDNTFNRKNLQEENFNKLKIEDLKMYSEFFAGFLKYLKSKEPKVGKGQIKKWEHRLATIRKILLLRETKLSIETIPRKEREKLETEAKPIASRILRTNNWSLLRSYTSSILFPFILTLCLQNISVEALEPITLGLFGLAGAAIGGTYWRDSTNRSTYIEEAKKAYLNQARELDKNQYALNCGKSNDGKFHFVRGNKSTLDLATCQKIYINGIVSRPQPEIAKELCDASYGRFWNCGSRNICVPPGFKGPEHSYCPLPGSPFVVSSWWNKLPEEAKIITGVSGIVIGGVTLYAIKKGVPKYKIAFHLIFLISIIWSFLYSITIEFFNSPETSLVKNFYEYLYGNNPTRVLHSHAVAYNMGIFQGVRSPAMIAFDFDEAWRQLAIWIPIVIILIYDAICYLSGDIEAIFDWAFGNTDIDETLKQKIIKGLSLFFGALALIWGFWNIPYIWITRLFNFAMYWLIRVKNFEFIAKYYDKILFGIGAIVTDKVLKLNFLNSIVGGNGGKALGPGKKLGGSVKGVSKLVSASPKPRNTADKTMLVQGREFLERKGNR
jgi:hypothetical protein